MVRIKEAIVVEGRYDKNTLSQIVDAPIFTTDGFGIFHNTQQMKLLRQVAQKRGLIVFTDSDGAGFVIRNHLKSAIDGQPDKRASWGWRECARRSFWMPFAVPVPQ